MVSKVNICQFLQVLPQERLFITDIVFHKDAFDNIRPQTLCSFLFSRTANCSISTVKCHARATIPT
jgi:hypothetical protein